MKELDRIKNLVASPLSPDFYRPHTVRVAQELLGKVLIVRSRPDLPFGHPDDGMTAGRIVETEAYRGNDPASHSSRGETPRCSIMFDEPGKAYVYFIYGMYEMLNFVTEPKGKAGAVLIRAVAPLVGFDWMKQRRGGKQGQNLKDLTSGPGKLCRAMQIEMSHNRESLQGPSLFVGDDGFRPQQISRSTRVGIRLAKDRLWRFFITNSPFVSPVRENSQSLVGGMEIDEED